MKRLIIILLILLLLLPYSSFAAVNVTVNGNGLSFDVPPVNVEGRILVPLRAIFEALGASVEWNSEEQQISAYKDDITIILSIDNKVALVNGQPITLDVAPKNINGRTMVPTRFIAESLGAEVKWDDSTSSVQIFTISQAETDASIVNQLHKYRIADNVTISTNLNADLLRLAAATGSGFTSTGYLSNNNAKKSIIVDHFKKYISNPAAKYLSEQAFKNSPVSGNITFPGSATKAILSYDQILNDNQIYDEQNPNTIVLQNGLIKCSELKELVDQFYKDTSGEAFFANNISLYNSLIDEFYGNYSFNYVQQLQEFFGMDISSQQFHTVITPMINAGEAMEIYDSNAIHNYVFINPIDCNNAQMLNLIYHETAHNFLQQIIRKNSSFIEKYSSYNGVLRTDYSDFLSTLNETLARAITVQMLKKYHGTEMANANLQNELRLGWKGLDQINELIESSYLTNRAKYKRFEDFLTVILEYIRNNSSETPESGIVLEIEKYSKVKNLLISDRESVNVFKDFFFRSKFSAENNDNLYCKRESLWYKYYQIMGFSNKRVFIVYLEGKKDVEGYAEDAFKYNYSELVEKTHTEGEYYKAIQESDMTVIIYGAKDLDTLRKLLVKCPLESCP